MAKKNSADRIAELEAELEEVTEERDALQAQLDEIKSVLSGDEEEDDDDEEDEDDEDDEEEAS